MPPPTLGSPAPSVEGIDFSTGPTALFFYKVTCPVCQMAAPKVETFETAYPGRIAGIGQDPPAKLRDFERSYGLTFGSRSEPPPYPASQAYGIRVVPTIVLVGSDGTVEAVAESWDRDVVNGVSRRLAELLGAPFVPISQEGDGLPAFRPG
jgi:thiol-disulfide isomerase/thioredoxin